MLRALTSRSVATGAAYGAVAWGAYAVVEVATCLLIPIILNERQIVTTAHWRFTGITVVSYLLAGLALGGMTALTLAATRAAPGQRFEAAVATAAMLGVVVAHLAHNAVEFRPDRIPGLVAVIVGVGLFASLVAGLARRRLPSPWLLAGDPWASAIAMILVPIAFDADRFATAEIPYLRNVILLLAGTSIVAAVSRWALYQEDGGAWRLGRQLMAVAVAAPVVVGSILLAEMLRDPYASMDLRPGVRSERPSVIFVVLDTVRADHMSVYGYDRDTTPFLRRFVSGATLYRRAIATSNYTLPTHASMFTGLYPRTHGAVHAKAEHTVARPLAGKFVTLAEALSDDGVAGFAVVANTFFLPRGFGLDQGFQLYDVRGITGCLPSWGNHFLRRVVARGLGRLGSTAWLREISRQSADVTRDLLAILDAVARPQAPFFLFANYMDAHGPYISPPPFNGLFTDARWPGGREIQDRVSMGGLESLTPLERSHYVSKYDGTIAYLDDQLKRLVERLRSQGIYDDSLIIITSDHGEAFDEGGVVGHSVSLYQHQLHVPLIIKFPQQREGRVVDAIVSHVDLMPTVLGVLGIQAAGEFQGRSLIDESYDPARSVLAEGVRRSNRKDWEYGAREWALVTEDLKMILSSGGEVELYDLSSDPQERQNIYEKNDGRSLAALAALWKWLRETPLEAGVTESLDPATQRHLEAHGYFK